MPEFIDLTGKTFREWKAIEYLGKSMWKCVNINNGEEKAIHSYSLRTQYSDYTNKTKIPDIVGKTFNNWKVIKYAGCGKWECQCSCGRTSEVTYNDLKYGMSKNCSNPIHRIKTDLKGQVIKGWEVLEYAGNMRWKCRCTCGCGAEKTFLTKYLKTGGIEPCKNTYNEVRHRVRKDISGQTFGYLKVIKYTGMNQMWECKCLNCGRTVNIFRDSLVSGDIKSCGCLREAFRAQTLLKGYGDNNTTRINNPREDWQIDAISSREKLQSYIETFKHTPTVWELAEGLDVNDTSIIKALKKFNLAESIVQKHNDISDIELSVVEYIKSFNLDIIQSDKTILNGKELDIYIPDKKIAIEFDGDYWHSAVFKQPTYHQEKTIACISKGIHLIHIFEYEWRNQEVRDKIKAYIKHLLDNSINKIYARNTEIKAVETAEAKEFIEKYHLQGYANAAVSLGCYYKNELIGIMTFGAPRFNSNYEYELIRLCWKTDWLVIGGSNKLFSQFIKEYNPNSIVSYCDLAKFSGTIYLELGFETSKTEVTKPSYVWIDSRNLTVYTRYQTQKQKLLDLGLGSLGDTEEEIMENLGYLKVYNSGNLRFHWNKN